MWMPLRTIVLLETVTLRRRLGAALACVLCTVMYSAMRQSLSLPALLAFLETECRVSERSVDVWLCKADHLSLKALQS